MKKIIFSSLVVMAVVAVSLIYSHGSLKSVAPTVQIVLDDVESLASGECINGGEGAVSCASSGGGTIAGFGGSAGCSVTCSTGYYACCGLTCNCVKNQ